MAVSPLLARVVMDQEAEVAILLVAATLLGVVPQDLAGRLFHKATLVAVLSILI